MSIVSPIPFPHIQKQQIPSPIPSPPPRSAGSIAAGRRFRLRRLLPLYLRRRRLRFSLTSVLLPSPLCFEFGHAKYKELFGEDNMSRNNINAVFYAEAYHPIQAGSIDGTDIVPHDNAVYRAQICSSAGLYDQFGDPKIMGDPYCTLFVGHLSHLTTEEILGKVMSKYGRVKNLRLVRDIVTGASRGYAFVEFETDREMRKAYEEAHHSIIDDSEIIVDYNRQQLMPGWIPRRLGGGLGGKKESGQLRFGGRERPFRAPLQPIPYDDLKRLGIPPPPEGRYMSRFEVPSPPRRKRSSPERGSSKHSHRRRRHSHHHSRRSRSSDGSLSG